MDNLPSIKKKNKLSVCRKINFKSKLGKEVIAIQSKIADIFNDSIPNNAVVINIKTAQLSIAQQVDAYLLDTYPEWVLQNWRLKLIGISKENNTEHYAFRAKLTRYFLNSNRILKLDLR